MVTQTKATNCTAAYTWYTRAHKFKLFVRQRSLRSRHRSKSSTKVPTSRKIVSIEIDYPGSNNKTELTLDSMGQCVKLTEVVGGIATSTKQFVWSDNKRHEERDGSGSLTKKFFARGQDNAGTKYFYSSDHLGSVRQLADNSGSIVQISGFDSFGRRSPIVETVSSDFAYAGYYLHSRSGLLLTLYRQYDPNLGRWLSRDPAESAANLYTYCDKNPLSGIDPLGLWSLEIVWTQVWGSQYHHGDLFLVNDDKTVVGSWSGQLLFNNTSLTMIEKPAQVFQMGTHQVVRSGCDKTINDMKARIDKAKASLNFPWKGVYRPLDGANSNTALYSLLMRAGISPPKPDVGNTPGYMNYTEVSIPK